MNPLAKGNLDRKAIKAEYEADTEKAYAEFGAQNATWKVDVVMRN